MWGSHRLSVRQGCAAGSAQRAPASEPWRCIPVFRSAAQDGAGSKERNSAQILIGRLAAAASTRGLGFHRACRSERGGISTEPCFTTAWGPLKRTRPPAMRRAGMDLREADCQLPEGCRTGLSASRGCRSWN